MAEGTFTGMVDAFVTEQVEKIYVKLEARYGERIKALEDLVDEQDKEIEAQAKTIAAMQAEIQRLKDGSGEPGEPPKEPPKEPPVDPKPDPEQPPADGEFADGLFIRKVDLMKLPDGGAPFEAIENEAFTERGPLRANELNTQTDVNPMAKALVAVRTTRDDMRRSAIELLKAAPNTPISRALELTRAWGAIMIAAMLLGFHDAALKAAARKMLTAPTSGGPANIVESMEKRANNWGTWAMFTCLCIYIYLGDKAGVARVAQIFKGWLGDRKSYAGFDYGDLDWQADKKNPVGINAKGAKSIVSGALRDVDGVITDDQRRDKFTWPPPKEHYPWEALQGAAMTAVILSQNGYPDVWEWQDQALRRAVRWLYDVADNPATGDDEGTVHIINAVYGTSYKVGTPVSAAKGYIGADWWAAALKRQ